MLFNDARKTICENCPSKNVGITQGFCIQKKNGKYFQIDSDAPSVVILFRDPTIKDPNPNRVVKYVLDIDDPKKKLNSTLFTFYKPFLDYFPDNEIIYLDNFIRCKMPFTTIQLKNNFLKLSDPYATCCYDISRSFLGRLTKLKCLIISDVKPIIWLGKKNFLTNISSDIKQVISDYQDDKFNSGENSTILLNERLNLDKFKFPVLFFPHPNTLHLQYPRRYAPGKKYYTEFKNHLNMIFDILKETEKKGVI
jgi:hypothetical protein